MIEKGRSMVEMLGVLAIIGVLSVGAIAGYSKAMMKYKLNKHAESFNLLLNNAIYIKPQLERAFIGTRFDTELFAKLNLIPDGMHIQGNAIYDIFNTGYSISYYTHPTNGNIDYVIYVGFDRTNNKLTRQSSEICRNIVTVAKENAANLYMLSLRSGQNDGTYSAQVFYGNDLCSPGRNCLYNVNLQQIDDFCNSCESENYCSMAIYLMVKKAA